MNKSKKQSAFTLIEVVIYMALFAIIMGGLITTTYQLSQSAGSLQGKGVTQEEMNFVLKKFDWALTGAQASTVDTSVSGQLKFKNTNISSNLIVIKQSGTGIQLCPGTSNCVSSGNFYPLTTANVKISNLSFSVPSTGVVKATFTIDTIPATFTKYLKI